MASGGFVGQGDAILTTRLNNYTVAVAGPRNLSPTPPSVTLTHTIAFKDHGGPGVDVDLREAIEILWDTGVFKM